MRRSSLSLLLLFILVGCASAGPAARNIPTEPPAAGTTRVTVERSTDFLYLALSARVRVNGEELGAISRGDAVSVDVAAGRTTVSVDTATSPGTFAVTLTTLPDHEYVFEVSPRSGSYGPIVTFGYVGAMIDATVNQQSGLFQVRGKSVREFDAVSKPKAPIEAKSSGTSDTPRVVIPSPNDAALKRLRDLKKMLDERLIDKNDYEQKKAEILNAL